MTRPFSPFAIAPSLLFIGFLTVADATPPRTGDLRVGLIGLDTSHVPAFLQIFNDEDAREHIPGVHIVAAFKGGSPDLPSSHNRIEDFTRCAVEQYGVKLHESIETLADEVDAIMILSVDGRPHLEQFRRTLAARKPVFIDKPFAGSLPDALAIVRLAEEFHVPCFSSSSFRYAPDSPANRLAEVGELISAYSAGPAGIEPHHPDLFWYGIHAVESLYTVMGPGCLKVVRTHTPNTDVVTGVWSKDRVGTVQGNRRSNVGYSVTVTGTKGILSGGQKHSYRPMAEAILKFFQTGVTPVPLETTIEIYAFMEAADESKRRGGVPVELSEVLEKSKTKP